MLKKHSKSIIAVLVLVAVLASLLPYTVVLAKNVQPTVLKSTKYVTLLIPPKKSRTYIEGTSADAVYVTLYSVSPHVIISWDWGYTPNVLFWIRADNP